jgi:hypothetical protein
MNAACLDCAAVIRQGSSRCVLCRRAYERRRRGNPTARYGPGYRARHRAAIAAEPWCHWPGGCDYPDAGTPANLLTCDHILPRSRFGYESPLTVLCRSHNSSKSDRIDRSARDGGRGVGTGRQREAGDPAQGVSQYLSVFGGER